MRFGLSNKEKIELSNEITKQLKYMANDHGNFEIRCIYGVGSFIYGHIYEVKNGIIMWANCRQHRPCYNLSEINNMFLSQFELVEDKEMEFKKSQLKDSMVVKLRDNAYGLALVVGERLLHKKNVSQLSCFNDDLIHKNYSSLDVVSIYKIRKASDINDVYDELNLILIWERKEEVIEMTMEEICKELGKNVKIVKGEK